VVRGAGRYTVIVDTGASGTLVSPRLAREAGVKSIKGSATMAVGAGGELPVESGYLSGVRIGSIDAKRLHVAIADLGRISAAIGTPIDGVMGYNLLKHYRLIIDYPRRELRLEPGGLARTTPGSGKVNEKRRSSRSTARRRKGR
jgi:predicted aspartyl protease